MDQSVNCAVIPSPYPFFIMMKHEQRTSQDSSYVWGREGVGEGRGGKGRGGKGEECEVNQARRLSIR